MSDPNLPNTLAARCRQAADVLNEDARFWSVTFPSLAKTIKDMRVAATLLHLAADELAPPHREAPIPNPRPRNGESPF